MRDDLDMAQQQVGGSQGRVGSLPARDVADMNENTQAQTGRGMRLEQRLLEAAEALLAHEGRRVMSRAFPGAEPPLFIVIGETPQLSELLAAANRELRSET
jgi:hypothetical protein